MDQQANLQSGVDDLLKEMGADGMGREEKDSLVAKMTELLLKRIFIDTMEKLSVQDQKDFEEMIDKGSSQEEVAGFLRGKIADYDAMVQKIVVDFKEEMKKEAKR